MLDRLPSNGDACSDAAADSMADHVKVLRRRVWEYVRDRGTAICDEVELALGLSHQTCSARFTELSDGEKMPACLVKTGEKRATRSGRKAWVYRVTMYEPA